MAQNRSMSDPPISDFAEMLFNDTSRNLPAPAPAHHFCHGADMRSLKKTHPMQPVTGWNSLSFAPDVHSAGSSQNMYPHPSSTMVQNQEQNKQIVPNVGHSVQQMFESAEQMKAKNCSVLQSFNESELVSQSLSHHISQSSAATSSNQVESDEVDCETSSDGLSGEKSNEATSEVSSTKKKDKRAAKSYYCLHCGIKFSSLKGRKEHERLHTGELSFQCSYCNKTFAGKANLTHHLQLYMGQCRFQCEQCGQIYASRHTLMKHLENHSMEKSSQCHAATSCNCNCNCNCSNKSFAAEKTSPGQGKSQKVQKPTYQCFQCMKTFAQKQTLTNHLKVHTGEKPHQCTYCEKTFRLKQSLVVHIRTHTGEKPFQCTVCDKKFTQMISLSIHKRVHTGEKPFQCTICGKMFKQALGLKLHERRHHAGMTNAMGHSNKQHQCTVCGKSFCRHSGLKVHMQQHTEERPHQCSYCDKTFHLQERLKVHERYHTDDRPYACPQCDVRCHTGQNLKRHIQIHTDERPFECVYCQKTFQSNGQLKEHMRIHAGERAYECSLCDESMLRNPYLKTPQPQQCHPSQLHNHAADAHISNVNPDTQSCGKADDKLTQQPSNFVQI